MEPKMTLIERLEDDELYVDAVDEAIKEIENLRDGIRLVLDWLQRISIERPILYQAMKHVEFPEIELQSLIKED